MDQVPLLIVEDSFFLHREPAMMLILHPDFSVPVTGWKGCTEEVSVLRPDGRQFDAQARLELSHFNIRDPEVPMDRRWRVTLWLIDLSKDEVPIGSTILGSPDLRNRLVPPC